MSRLLILAFLLSATTLSAQSLPTVSYTVTIWQTNSGGTPLSSVTYPVSAVVCGQPKLPADPPPNFNPTEGRFDDPDAPGSDCVIDLKAQIAPLDSGTNLVAAFRSNGLPGEPVRPYGPVTDPFERRLGPPRPPQNPRLRK